MSTKAIILLAALMTHEPAWWEGSWAEEGVACNGGRGDVHPIRLAWDRIEFPEAECFPLKEEAGKGVLVLRARCREHGDPAPRNRRFTLRPAEGGATMTISDGKAEWHLRRCPPN